MAFYLNFSPSLPFSSQITVEPGSDELQKLVGKGQQMMGDPLITQSLNDQVISGEWKTAGSI